MPHGGQKVGTHVGERLRRHADGDRIDRAELCGDLEQLERQVGGLLAEKCRNAGHRRAQVAAARRRKRRLVRHRAVDVGKRGDDWVFGGITHFVLFLSFREWFGRSVAVSGGPRMTWVDIRDNYHITGGMFA